MNDNPKPTDQPKIIRCAIYTRVSTTDNLEQDFTSLDVQRESAESYIASQKQEGWVVLPERFDDAGFTGANTDRPALKKLIERIKAGGLDCIIVYKVDRLSRSLLDFTQLLEFFDKSKVAFVSVTQQFNTNTSMGRLTLNILLSFAQFEREMISERTKDKMAAARRKGRFVGGRAPIGYDINKETHQLVINPLEAILVRKVFDLYLKHRSCIAVAVIINDEGFLTKKTPSKGRPLGGLRFKNTNILWILRNVVYKGKVCYQNEIMNGVHEAIIKEETFDMVQKIISANRRTPQTQERAKGRGTLSQLLRCKNCNSAMFFNYTYKKKVRLKYCYYTCVGALKRGYHTCPTRTIRAQIVDDQVVNCIKQISGYKDAIPSDWSHMTVPEKQDVLKNIVKVINYDGVTRMLAITAQDGKDYCFEVDTKKPVIETPEEIIKKEPQLRQNLILAHQIQKVLDSGRGENIRQISGWLNLSPARVNQFMSLLLLSPAIQEAILFGADEKITAIPEYKLNNITRETLWSNQLVLWQQLASQAH
jgi:DNA invertase Pin-like site-specific DNA recombinase